MSGCPSYLLSSFRSHCDFILCDRKTLPTVVVLLAPYLESSASDSGAGIVQLHKVSIFKKKFAIVEVVCM